MEEEINPYVSWFRKPTQSEKIWNDAMFAKYQREEAKRQKAIAEELIKLKKCRHPVYVFFLCDNTYYFLIRRRASGKFEIPTVSRILHYLRLRVSLDHLKDHHFVYNTSSGDMFEKIGKRRRKFEFIPFVEFINNPIHLIYNDQCEDVVPNYNILRIIKLFIRRIMTGVHNGYDTLLQLNLVNSIPDWYQRELEIQLPSIQRTYDINELSNALMVDRVLLDNFNWKNVHFVPEIAELEDVD